MKKSECRKMFNEDFFEFYFKKDLVPRLKTDFAKRAGDLYTHRHRFVNKKLFGRLLGKTYELNRAIEKINRDLT